jgi:hypothetical protein
MSHVIQLRSGRAAHVAAGALAILGFLVDGDARAEPPLAATIETTLSTASDQIRQLAFDGDQDTFFASGANVGPADHFTLAFDKPAAVKSIRIVTGRPDGDDALDAGTLQVSSDGKAFEDLAKFSSGAASAELNGKPLRAVRIVPAEELKHSLAIREIEIESQPAVSVFRYPVEFVVDASDAPEMKPWADEAARICERAYPMINEELKSDGFKPPRLVRMTLKPDYRGVAAASGDRIVGSVRFFKEHPDDFGAMVHETAHVVQHYRGGKNPGWLVEGVADYVRFFKFEPGNLGRIDPKTARYDGSYRVTAAFLAYLVEKYDKQIVLKLNQRMRDGQYEEKVFQELTGKSLQELDAEWRALIGSDAGN